MDKGELSFRQAKRADVPLILSFIQALADYEKLSQEVTADPALLEHWLFDRQAAQVLFGIVDGKEVGFALYFFNFSTFLGKGGLYLEDLYILPEFRGRGYGHSFFHQLARVAVQEGCGRMEWCCLDWNLPSIGFYQSLGARPMSEWTTYRLTGPDLQKLASP